MKTALVLALLVGLLGGCSFFGPNEPARLTLRLFSPAAAQLNFRIAYSDGEKTRVLPQGDFTQVGAGQFIAGPFATATSGVLNLTCAILDADGEAQATAEVALPLRPDWRYGVDCAVADVNPFTLCFGCLGSQVQALEPMPGLAASDSLYVVWGGTSISTPVIY